MPNWRGIGANLQCVFHLQYQCYFAGWLTCGMHLIWKNNECNITCRNMGLSLSDHFHLLDMAVCCPWSWRGSAGKAESQRSTVIEMSGTTKSNRLINSWQHWCYQSHQTFHKKRYLSMRLNIWALTLIFDTWLELPGVLLTPTAADVTQSTRWL